MFNCVHIEGFVTKRIWRHSGDLFIRIANYRDPDRPRKESRHDSPNKRDQPDYVTIRVPAALTTLPVEFQSGQRVQVDGWLESREFDYTLAEFLKDAQGDKPEIDPEQAKQLSAHRGTTWIVATRILTLPERDNSRGRKSKK